MKTLRFWALIILVGIVATATATAALSSVSFDRNVESGLVLSDTDENVTVRFTNLSNYSNLLTTTNGKATFNLDEALGGAIGYNTDATYSIGDENDALFSITNNTDVTVSVSLNSSVISLLPTTGSSLTVTPGQTSTFYFELDTTNVSENTNLVATMSVTS